MGNTFGRQGDRVTQRAILHDALAMLVECDRPGELVDLPYEWPEQIAFRPKRRDASYQASK